LSKLLGRDCFNDGEIRLYAHADIGDEAAEIFAGRSGEDITPVEFESLDLDQLAPYLLLLAAQDRAEALLAEAASAAERSCLEARRQGVEQGLADAKENVLPALVAFADAGQSLIVFEEQLISSCTPQIVSLALEIAEKVVGKALAEDPSIIASVLERAKQQVNQAKQIRVRLHPEDFKFLAETRPGMIKMGELEGRLIEILPSEEISRGGCRLETEIGVVDATMPTQLDEIRRQLLDDGAPTASTQHIAARPEFDRTMFEER